MALLRDIIMDRVQPYANHDLSRRNRITASAGPIYPVLVEEVLPGDTFHIRSSASIQTYPLLAPLMGSFRLQLSYFFVPTRLYTQTMDVNRLSFDPASVSFPYANYVWHNAAVLTNTSNANGYTVNSSSKSPFLGSILDYMGYGLQFNLINQPFSPATNPTIIPQAALPRWNATPLIGYYDCFRNYFCNTQEDIFYIFGCRENSQGSSTDIGPAVKASQSAYFTQTLYAASLASLDNFIYSFIANEGQNFEYAWWKYFLAQGYPWFSLFNPLLGSRTFGSVQVDNSLDSYGNFQFYGGGAGRMAYDSNVASQLTLASGQNQVTLNVPTVDLALSDYRNHGLVLATHRPDMFTAWMSKSQYDDMVSSSQINVTNNQITINQIRMGNHLIKYYERGLVAGGRYADWVYAEFGVKNLRNLCIPQLLGVSSSSLVFNEVVSTSNSESTGGPVTAQGLGGLSGRGVGFLNGYRQTFHSDEHGYLLGLFTIIPNVSYATNVNPLYLKTEYQDLYAPVLAQLGFQTLQANLMDAGGTVQFSESGTNNYLSSGFPNSVFTGISGVSISGFNDSLSIGFQPAWQEYMTSVDSVHSDLGVTGRLYYWSIVRNFSARLPFELISSLSASPLNNLRYTSYVIPYQYDYGFADQSLNAQNFICEFNFDVVARRQVGKRVMPSL